MAKVLVLYYSSYGHIETKAASFQGDGDAVVRVERFLPFLQTCAKLVEIA